MFISFAPLVFNALYAFLCGWGMFLWSEIFKGQKHSGHVLNRLFGTKWIFNRSDGFCEQPGLTQVV